MSASTLAKYKDLSDDQKDELYSSIVTNTCALTRMIEKVTFLSEIQDEGIKLDLEDYFPFKIIKHIISVFEEEISSKNLVIDLDVTERIKLVGSKSRINQIFRILIENAIETSPQDGKISIASKDLYIGDYNKENREGVLFQVMDEGSGIPSNELPYIFERFYRTKEKENVVGLGLGLVIARELVYLHQGSIFVNSETKKGSIFSVFLPYLS